MIETGAAEFHRVIKCSIKDNNINSFVEVPIYLLELTVKSHPVKVYLRSLLVEAPGHVPKLTRLRAAQPNRDAAGCTLY